MDTTSKQPVPVPLPEEFRRTGRVWRALRDTISSGCTDAYVDELARALVSAMSPGQVLAYDCVDDLIAGDRGSTSGEVLKSVQRSVQQSWALVLPMQQQGVLLLATRGPDGIAKDHPIKPIVQAYRATVLNAAHIGRPFSLDDVVENRAPGDTFMTLEFFRRPADWAIVLDRFFRSIDNVSHHYLWHLAHGAQIIGYKHPDVRMRIGWRKLYFAMVEDMHLNPETEQQMDARLNDWGREGWVR